MTYIEELKNINLKDSNPDSIRNILQNHIFSCTPLYINNGTCILRVRKGGGFKERKEMTYCPIEKCHNLQRASLAGNTMFYGVISDNQRNLENAQVVATSECSKLCRDGVESVGRETFTISHWVVIKQLNVISFITDKTFPEINDNDILNYIRNTTKQHLTKNSILEETQLSQFLSDEFSKKVNPDENYQYLISATIATDIVNDMGFDGIIYPSVQLSGQGGVNIAIKPQAVDNKLKFIKTFDQTLFKKLNKSLIRLENETECGRTKRITHISDEYVKQVLDLKDLKELPLT